MAKKKGKSVSFDAMVKFFMNNYQIPTKRDLEAVITRLDRIERLIVTSGGIGRRGARGSQDGKQLPATASDTVLEVIHRYPKGIGFSDIKMQTGFGEKKLRNILFRLNKSGKIKRKQRGIYEPA